jgi:hypothetical protein
MPKELLGYLCSSPRPDVLLNTSEMQGLIDAVEIVCEQDISQRIPWDHEVPGYLDYRVALPDVRDACGVSAAEAFAGRCEDILARLSADGISLSDGLRVVADWIHATEDAVRGCGYGHLLPRPEGRHPTPTQPGRRPGKRQRRMRSEMGESEPAEQGEWISTEQIRKRVHRGRPYVIAAMDAGHLPFERRGQARYARLTDVKSWEARLVAGDRPPDRSVIHPDLKHLAG